MGGKGGSVSELLQKIFRIGIRALFFNQHTVSILMAAILA
jgi:hypothetical protein